MPPTEPLAISFALRAIRARIKAEQASGRRKVDREKLRARMYQQFALRLRNAASGEAIWTKE
jgi:hypothetical protein